MVGYRDLTWSKILNQQHQSHPYKYILCYHYILSSLIQKKAQFVQFSSKLMIPSSQVSPINFQKICYLISDRYQPLRLYCDNRLVLVEFIFNLSLLVFCLLDLRCRNCSFYFNIFFCSQSSQVTLVQTSIALQSPVSRRFLICSLVDFTLVRSVSSLKCSTLCCSLLFLSINRASSELISWLCCYLSMLAIVFCRSCFLLSFSSSCCRKTSLILCWKYLNLQLPMDSQYSKPEEQSQSSLQRLASMGQRSSLTSISLSSSCWAKLAGNSTF